MTPTGTPPIPAGADARSLALSSWPPRQPLAALWSADYPPRLARPTRILSWRPATGWRGHLPKHALPPDRPLRTVDHLWRSHLDPDSPGAWLLILSYDLARQLEPTAQGDTPPANDRDHPDLILARGEDWTPTTTPSLAPRPFTLRSPDLNVSKTRFTGAVRDALRRIADGDVYQVNLTHRLSASFAGSARALADQLLARARPWHGLYLELDEHNTRRVHIGASPELFLEADLHTRRVLTRPMKGTRPAESDPSELRESPKDRAELDMITDLMRNDLGRVCAFGSVRVEDPRVIERHASGVLQATSRVSGRLRDDVAFEQLIHATFPPGSVTGAPKVRAMQLIDELEDHRRGPYCGACGVLTDTGRLSLGVSIRTATLTGRPAPDALDALTDATLDFPVGAGIVSDSDPDAEWDETLVKARALLAAIPAP
ncbi:MAG: anthranilate synthase component I family protein [Phycisphaerales bacterium JB059]